MLHETLIVYAPDKASYHQWVRKYGCYFRNVLLVWANGEDGISSYPKKGTYWTTLEGWEQGPVQDTEETKNFQYLDREKIEEAVKGFLKRNPKKVLTY